MLATVPAPRKADVTNDADEPSARHQRGMALTPNLIELLEKLFIVLDPPQLAIGRRYSLRTQ